MEGDHRKGEVNICIEACILSSVPLEDFDEFVKL